MGFEALQPHTLGTTLASFATNSSSGVLNAFAPGRACEVVGARVIASASQPAATTTGSGITVTLYKNASNAASVIGSFNSSGSGFAANTRQPITLQSAAASTGNKRLTSSDVVLLEAVGGAAMGSTVGMRVEFDVVYGHETGATPAAASAPSED